MQSKLVMKNFCVIILDMYDAESLRDIFICGDALNEMRKFPDESVDLIITSPPYNLKNSTGNGMKNGSCGKWSNAALINGYANYDDNMPYDEYVQWQRNCLSEMMRLINDYFLPTYEVIYLIAKPNFKLVPHANSLGDVWEFPQEMKNKHPAPFPVALVERIISSTSAKIILDPFMGSGTTAVASKNLGRNFIGIEISPEYCEMSKERLSGCQVSQHSQSQQLLLL